MDDLLVEIDTETLKVSRHFLLTKGREAGMSGSPETRAKTGHARHDSGGHGLEQPKPGDVSCSPTWAQPSADGSSVISVEGVGSEPGAVEIIDLEMLKTVGVVDVAQQAAGIDFLRTEPVKK